jgi:hypothetical protein
MALRLRAGISVADVRRNFGVSRGVFARLAGLDGQAHFHHG